MGEAHLILGPSGGGQTFFCGLFRKCLSFCSAAASAPAWVVAYVLRIRFLLGFLVCFSEPLKNAHHDFLHLHSVSVSSLSACGGGKVLLARQEQYAERAPMLVGTRILSWGSQ